MRNGLYLLVLLLGLGFDAAAQPFVKPSKIGTLSVLSIEINDNNPPILETKALPS